MDRIRLEIVEQPQQRGMRFRYECEGRSAGSIPGENTTADKKTWPACQIVNYSGLAVMRVSLVSKDDPPRPHPHSLVGRDCDKGVCQTNLDPSNQMLGTFSNLGIQCVRRREVNSSILDRIRNNVNPFDTVLDDERSSVDVDLNIVRLCFEAFLPDHSGHYTIKLNPVVSNPIYDKKATCAGILKICRVDKTHGSAQGKDEVFLLCDKVQKEDIQVVFSKGDWEALAEFSSIDVHRQVAIVFRTPPFKDQNIQESVEVEFKLRRPSDAQVSKSLQFTYLPMQHEGKHKIFPNMPTPSSSNDGRHRIRSAIEKKFKESNKRLHSGFHRPGPSQIVKPPHRPPPPWMSQPGPFEVKTEPQSLGQPFFPTPSSHPHPSSHTPFNNHDMPPNMFTPTTIHPFDAQFQDFPDPTSQIIPPFDPQTFTTFPNGGMTQEKFPSVGPEMTADILKQTEQQPSDVDFIDDLIKSKLSIDFDKNPAEEAQMSITDNTFQPNITSHNQHGFHTPNMPGSSYQVMQPQGGIMSPPQQANMMSPQTIMSPPPTLTPLHHQPNNVNTPTNMNPPNHMNQPPMMSNFLPFNRFHTNNNNNLFNFDMQLPQQGDPDPEIADFLKGISDP
uniref:Rel1 n=1 Tax=Phallusia mammillata TaxID=59560 RepID=A0A6F9DQX9_9ASCI|nr:rel1 [Phallusia mammillata]